MTNPRLAGVASLYLRQHADDPVDWHVWGAEAFDAARQRQVPVFLSSGYSACHWCHVMQRESFADPEIAAVLNDRFVPVKVDRELRPDVDALYMDYVVATTGNGGWPLSVFLDADLIPLLGGTYFPPQARPGVPAFVEVLEEVDEAFRAGGDSLASARAGSLEFLRGQASPRMRGEAGADTVDSAAEIVVRFADQVNGGFGTAPKFPQAPLILFLCAYHRRNPDPEVTWSVTHSVSSMIRGGIYDQAGGGLFRYSTDATWSVPHFEKMLYSQGLLLSTLAAAARVAGTDEAREEYGHAARQTAAFLDREMSLPGGGFAASLSADQAGIEGGAYLWSTEQLSEALEPGELAFALEHLVDEETPSGTETTLTRRGGRAAHGARADAILAKLLEARAARPRPEVDDKLVTAYNALAARGLLEAGAAFDDPSMIASGLSLLDVLLERCVTTGGVLRVPGDESVKDVRIIEDAAHLAAACLTAHELTGSADRLDSAVDLHRSVLDTFSDGEGLSMVSEATDLPVRPREQSDEPTPSGAATTAETAVRLGALTGDCSHLDLAARVLSGLWAVADLAPEQAGKALEATIRLLETDT